MRLSVVIPVLNEEDYIASTLASVKAAGADEVIVVDGGSTDKTGEIVARTHTRLVAAPRGRARQMNAGARLARGDVLLFLHADTSLPASALADIQAALSEPSCVGGRFDVRLDGAGWALALVAGLINLRSRLTRVATGDQAIFVRHSVFDQLDGFADVPLMEDIAFCRRLKRTGRVACLKSQVVTSARRWDREGVLRTIVKMWILKTLYLAGVSPATLRRFYPNTR